MGGLSFSSATIWPPSGITSLGLSRQQADQMLAVAARRVGAAESERLPRKSGFCLLTIQSMPRSWGVAVPSVSWPDDDEALLGAQHMHGLGAVGHELYFSPAVISACHSAMAIARRGH